MSGFVGLAAGEGKRIDGDLLARMTQFLAYRGPDRQEFWHSEDAGLGHALLATTDEAKRERQPLTFGDGVYLAADCRVDGRAELKAELRGGGREVAPDATDPELILHAYHAWGEACVEHLIGDFAFAVWDGPQRKLFGARDQSGVKLFYYAVPQRGFVCGNTLQCLRLYPEISADLDDVAVLDFLMVGRSLDLASTFFATIRALPAAHCLTWRGGETKVRRYWTRPIDEPVYYRRQGEYVEQFVSLLDAAIRDRLRTDKVCVQMSGGLDSTLLAARIRKAAGAGVDLEAHSIYFQGLIPDTERPYTETAARHLGIPLRLVRGDEYTPFQGHAELSRRMPEPICEPSWLVNHDLCRGMAAHSRVSFYGEGPDDLLLYEWAAYIRRMRQGGRYFRIAADAIRSFAADRRIPLAFWARRRPVSAPSALPTFPEWIRPEMVSRYRLRERWESFFAVRRSEHPWRPAAYAAMSSPSWNPIFVHGDPGVSGLHSEIRHPYLDLRVSRFLLAIPAIPWCRRKLIVRQASRQVLPEAIWRRNKTALGGDYTRSQMERGAMDGYILPPLPDFARYVTEWPTVAASGHWEPYLSGTPAGLAYWWQAERERRA